MVASRAIRDSLLEEPGIAQVAKLWEGLTMALVGIGSVEPSQLLVSSGNTLPESDLQKLGKLGAIGDVCLNF